MEPIRLSVLVDPAKGSQAAVDSLARQIDSSMQLAAQKASAGFEAMATRLESSMRRAGAAAASSFSGVHSELSKIDSQLNGILAKLSRLGTGGGSLRGGGGVTGGAPGMPAATLGMASPNWSFLFQTQTSQILAALNAKGGPAAPSGTPTNQNLPSAPLLNTASSMFIAREIWNWGKTILSGVNDYLFQPFIKFGKTILDVNDNFRKFEISLSGVSGGLGRSQMLSTELIRLSRNSPLTMSQIHGLGDTAAFIPALTSQVAQRDPAAAAQAIDQFSRIAGKLHFLAPEQGKMGASIAMREAYAGQFQSISRRFNVRKEDLAASIGLTFEQLNAEPSKILPALEKYLESVVPDSAFDKMGDRIDVQAEKLRDTLRAAGRKIANSGFYDNLLERLKYFRGELDKYIDSPQFDKLANRIGGMYDRVAGNVTRGGVSLLRTLSGSSSDAASFEDVGEQLGMLADRFGELSDALIPVAEGLGAMLKAAMDFVGWVAGLPGQGNLTAKNNRAVQAISEATGIPYSTKRGPGVGADDMGFWQSVKYGVGADQGIEEFYFDDAARKKYEKGQPSDFWAKTGSRNALDHLLMRTKYLGRIPSDFTPEAYGFPADFSLKQPGDSVAPNIRRKLREIGDPNYAAQARSISSIFSRFGEDGDGGSGYDKYQRQMSDLFQQAGGLGKLIRDIERDRDTQRSSLENIAETLSGNLGAAGIDTKFLKGKITDSLDYSVPGDDADKFRESAKKAIEDFIAKTPKQQQEMVRLYTEAQTQFVQYGETSSAVIERLVRAVPQSLEAYANGLAQNFQSSAQGSQVLDPIINGTSKFAQAIAKDLEVAVATWNEFSLKNKIQIMAAYIPARRTEILQAGPTGGYLSIEQRLAMDTVYARERYGQPQSDRATLLAQLEFEKSQMMGINRRRSEARYRASLPGATDAHRELFQRADDEMRQQEASLRKLDEQLDYTKRNFMEFGSEVRSALDNSVGQGIYDLIRGTGTLGDAFRSLADDIIRAFSRMAANSIITGLIGNLGQPQQNGGYGGLGGIIGGLFGMGGTPATAADGAIFPGGWRGIGMYAGGGVVKGGRGQIGIIGEGGPGRDEAIVPMVGGAIPLRLQGGGLVAALPGGRSIPAGVMAFADGGIAQGGFGGHYDLGAPMPVSTGGDAPARRMYEVVQVRSEGEARRQGYNPSRGDLLRFVAQDVAKGGVVAKAIKRRA